MNAARLLYGPNYYWSHAGSSADERGVGFPPDAAILTWQQFCEFDDIAEDAREDHIPHFGSCQDAADAGYGDDDEPPGDDLYLYIEYLYLHTICNAGRI